MFLTRNLHHVPANDKISVYIYPFMDGYNALRVSVAGGSLGVAASLLMVSNKKMDCSSKKEKEETDIQVADVINDVSLKLGLCCGVTTGSIFLYSLYEYDKTPNYAVELEKDRSIARTVVPMVGGLLAISGLAGSYAFLRREWIRYRRSQNNDPNYCTNCE